MKTADWPIMSRVLWRALLVALMAPLTLLAQSQSPATEALERFDASIDQIAERVSPAVVQVLVSGLGQSRRKGEQVLERQRGIGSGVIVDPDGYIITNAHVVEGARRIRVVLTSLGTELMPGETSMLRRQRTFEAKLVGTHRLTDLALLKIDEKNLPHFFCHHHFVSVSAKVCSQLALLKASRIP